LPSIALNHLYTFVALTIVSILLISSYSSYANTLQTIPEIEQLKNILDHVAGIRIHNDTSNVWIEGALGQIDESGREYEIFLPGKASTWGYYIGGYGPAMLECYMNGSIPQLNLSPAGGLRGP
jgi:hypothetical protein